MAETPSWAAVACYAAAQSAALALLAPQADLVGRPGVQAATELAQARWHIAADHAALSRVWALAGRWREDGLHVAAAELEDAVRGDL